ncbi:MAG: T9SS type A sorting domain-containing protein [Bacteroidia bacterium]|nr:T9SS type A sorting domain-containing protein [Bacteroidia bacterium]
MLKRHIIFSIIFFFAIAAYGQSQDTRSMYLDPPTDDFAQIQQMMEQHFEGKDKGRGSGYKQWKRWEYLNSRRLTSEGKITNWAERNFDEYHRYMAMHDTEDQRMITNGSWTSMAPSSWVNGTSGYNGGLGRVNCVAFHPTIVSTIYIGTPAGGLWRSTNTGSTWTSLTDGIPSIGVSGIAVANSNTIYILTGDGDGGDTDCIGVLKSTNAGETWLSTGLSFSIPTSTRGYKLVMSPANSNILLAATSAGLYRTTNGGVSWSVVQSGSFRDIEYKSDDPTVVFAVTTNTFYRSTDSGATWTAISGAPLPTGESRIAIAVSPANANYIYYLAGPGGPSSGQFKGFYCSVDAGLTWISRSTTPNILNSSLAGTGTSSQSTYDLAVAVSGTSVSTILTGGINVWKSTNFGSNWTINSHWNTGTATANGLEYTHADIHALELNPLDNSIWCGSDGGIFRTTNNGTTWTDLSTGLRIMQFYKIAGTPANSNLIIGGTQDNGSNEWDGGSSVDHMYGADGMDCMIDHSNSNIYYFSTQNGGLRKSTNGGSTCSSIKPSGSSGSWVTPYVMNPSNSSIIYAGYSDIYKTTNGGTSWSISTTLSGSGALAHGTNNTNRVYASSGSQIYMTNDAGGTWTNVSTGLPSITITDITVNPDNSPEVWVTFGGYTAGEKVYRSANAGTSWTNMSGSLPNVPINCIAFEDNNASPDDAVYVGADVGIFYRDATLGAWTTFSNWLPNVPVFDLEIHQANNVIRAGTYGRGLWTSATYTSCQASWVLGGTAAPGYSFYQASDFITSTREINGGLGSDLHFKAANSITLNPGFWAHENSEFEAFLGPCSAGIPAAQTKLSGTYAGPMGGVIEQTVENDMIFTEENSYIVYPNPFNESTTVEYSLTESANFSIFLTDIYGKVIKNVVEKTDHPEGVYKVNIDGSQLAAGLYFCHIVKGNKSEVVKLILEH